jgi:hypothetical protein
VAVKDLDGDGRADLVTAAGGRVVGYAGRVVADGGQPAENEWDLGDLAGVYVG